MLHAAFHSKSKIEYLPSRPRGPPALTGLIERVLPPDPLGGGTRSDEPPTAAVGIFVGANLRS